MRNLPSPARSAWGRGAAPARATFAIPLDSFPDSPESARMTARIYQRPKNAMQSGKAQTDTWLLEFVPAEAKRPDPLMGWSGSGDTQQQVVLQFGSEAEAQAYAARYGIETRVQVTPPKRLKLQAYADNFR